MKLLVNESDYDGPAYVCEDQDGRPTKDGPYLLEVPDDVGERWKTVQAEYDAMVKEIDRLIRALP